MHVHPQQLQLNRKCLKNIATEPVALAQNVDVPVVLTAPLLMMQRKCRNESVTMEAETKADVNS